VEGKKQKDNPEQSRRFEETARELGVDESGKTFERVFKTVLPKKPDRSGDRARKKSR
jgi:hypothetical protein